MLAQCTHQQRVAYNFWLWSLLPGSPWASYLTSLGLNIIIYEMGVLLPVKPTLSPCWSLQFQTSEELSCFGEALGTKPWLRPTHKNRALERGEKDSVNLLFCYFITDLMDWGLGPSSEHLFCFREVDGHAQRASSLPTQSLLHQPPLGRTEHLPQVTCSYSAFKHVINSQVVHGFPGLGVLPSQRPLSLTVGPGRLRKDSVVASGPGMEQDESLKT